MATPTDPKMLQAMMEAAIRDGIAATDGRDFFKASQMFRSAMIYEPNLKPTSFKWDKARGDEGTFTVERTSYEGFDIYADDVITLDPSQYRRIKG